ncbi:MAG TPA: universal stress protein [Acidobacteriaceae bacterium]
MNTQTGTSVETERDIAAQPTKQRASKCLPALKVKHLLLCTDFSPESHRALEAAVLIWRQTNARITVLHVCEYGPIAAPTDEGLEYVEKLYQTRYRKLREVVDELRGFGIESEFTALDGNAASVILDMQARLGFDMVVLGTRATLGVERFIFGSTAEAVFRKASCAVVTAGLHCRALDSFEIPMPIVFATDFSEGASEALNYAVAMANQFGTSLHCVHVLPLDQKDDHDLVVEGIMKDALKQQSNNGASCRLAPVWRVLYGTDVSEAIVGYAEEKGAQAIVLGVRRKPRVASHLPPQRTYRITMAAPCPVVTISSEYEKASAIAGVCF